MSDYMHKEYKLPNGRTVTADFNELGCAMVTIQAMDALFDMLNSSQQWIPCSERLPTTKDDLISRQAAIDALWKALYEYEDKTEKQFIDSEELDVADWIQHRNFVQNMSDIDRQTILGLPSAQPEQHYCRECKWSWCHINVDKHGKSETYWRCLNWDGETDEEGYCHEWERRTDG